MEVKEYKLCNNCYLILPNTTNKCPVCGKVVDYNIKASDKDLSALELDGYKVYSKSNNNNTNKSSVSKERSTGSFTNKVNSIKINSSQNNNSSSNKNFSANSVNKQAKNNAKAGGFAAFNFNNSGTNSTNNKSSIKASTLNKTVKTPKVKTREEKIAETFEKVNPVDNSDLVRDNGPITINYLYALDGVQQTK